MTIIPKNPIALGAIMINCLGVIVNQYDLLVICHIILIFMLSFLAFEFEVK